MDQGAGRPCLRELREQRGWTQADVARHLVRVAWLRRRERIGVNADMVAKWERGVKGVSARYRDLLCLVFEVDAEGLALDGQSSTPVFSRSASEQDGALESLADTATLLGQLGPAGAILQPKMFEVWRDEIIRRRALLKFMALAPAADLASADALQTRSIRPNRDTIAALDDLAGRYQTLYHSTAPRVLLAPVVAHLDTIRDALRNTGLPLRRKLLANRARVATLAGRLTFFDLHDAMGARSYYNLALESAREASDHHLAAAALGHVAFIPAAEHGFAAAKDYLHGASQHLTRHAHGPLSSWLAAVESEIQTNAGQHGAALAAIDRAQEGLARPGLVPALPWFDYYDETRLAGFTGYAALRAGDFDRSRAALTDALDQLPEQAVKQRAVFLSDLATVHLHDGDLDEACRTAVSAADELHRAGYATGSDRLHQFRAAVAQWSDTPAVRMLDEQLAVIA